MRLILPKKSFFVFLIVLFFSVEGFSQCSIVASRNTTGLSCGTSPLSTCGGILYIGNGTNAMTLTMTSNLNLTCLGPIRFIIRNGASVDFSSGNYDLQLAAGSSIEIENGGQLGAATNCSASDLIKIGTVNVASCNGGGGGVLTDFPGLVESGGYSSINVTANPSSLCNSGSTTLTATASPSSGATYRWYNVQTGGSVLHTGSTYTPFLTTTTTYYVEASYTSPAYTTVRKAVTVTVNNTAAPTGTASQSFCASSNPTVANLSATGTAIKWYSTPTGGSALPTNTVLTNGTHYYASQTLNSCESATRFDVTATVSTAPSTPGMISGSATQCSGNTLQVYSVSSVANATSYTWTVNTGSGWAITSGQGTNSITVTVGTGSANISVNAINSCGIGYGPYKWIAVSTPTVAGTVTPANSTVCSGSNSTNLSLSGNTGSILRWESSLDNFAGGTITTISNTGSPITASNLTVDTYYRAVVQSGGCNVLYSNSVKITVLGNTATPGAISGSATQCVGNTSQVYSISPVANATNYTWTVDTGSGWVITSGQGTNSITVTVGTGSANISVNANNSCSIGYGPYKWIAVSTPTVAGTVTPANSTVCSGSNSTNLSLSGNTGSILRWESSLDNFAGGTITTISNTGSPITASNLTVDTYYRAVVQSGGCNVLYSNSVKITVLGNTATPGAISGSATQCVGNTSQVYSISPVANATNYTWTVDTGSGWVITSGQGTNSITVTVGTGSANISVNANNSCSIGYGPYKWIAVSASSNGGSLPANVSGCANSYIANISLSGYIGTPIQWESSLDNFATTPTVIATTANNINITNLTQTTYYRAVVQNSPCAAISYSSVCMATVNINTVSNASSSPNVCTGSMMGGITHTTTGATGIGTAVGLPTGVAASWSSNTITISGTPTNGGTFNYSIPLTGGCGTVNAVGTITVTSLSSPIAGTPTNPSCKVPTGSVSLSGLPSTGTIIQTGERNDSIDISGGGLQTITNLHPGTYYFAVSNGTCTSETVTVVIIAPETNTWSTGTWSEGTPTINQRLVFASNYPNTIDADIEGCSCQVTGSTVVTIKSGRTLKIENGVEVQPGATLTFENNASLVQINDAAVNSGDIRYHRHTAPVKRYDFTYWSSPVSGQTMKALSPNTLGDKYYSYNPSTGWKIEYNGALTMEAGKGYIIRAPQTFSITVPAIDINPVFVGMPNNGLVSFSITANQTHLLGNPYPSAIDADKFIAANSTSLEGTLYFWTHNTSPSKNIAGDAIYNYTTNDYITYNKTGGVNVATGKIAAGQGFFAPASATGGTIVFNNAMRYTEGQPNYDNSQFLKINTASKTATTTTTTEKNRVWLNLTNTEGAFKQTLVGYITGATNSYDPGYDGVSYDGNQFVDFYSINNAVNLSIQGRALPFVKQDSVALGYKSTIKGEFKISIDHTDGTLNTQNIFLEDKDLKVLHDLKKEAYTFSTEKGAFNNRFILRYVDKNAVEPVVETPVVETPVVDSSVTVSVKQDQITVSSSEDLISKIIIYDIAGKIIYQKEDVSANDFMIQYLLSSKQVLLVTLVLENGKTTSTKIVY